MKNLFFIIILFLPGLLLAQVKVYEGQETIPTYQLGPDVKSPVFYTGRGVQGAAGHIYPYPAQTNLGEELTPVTYEMVYLENEYLKVAILPEFGGKLFSAIDKTNGHELFHTNSVIKPDLIGTLGAWISGGIGWCFPHHHRTTTLMPADYMIVKNADGSATVWVGETEKDLRLRGIVGITLRPGRSYIETEYRLNNPTELTRNFLFWANVAVTADENFRTFWPPSQEIGVFHSNTSFTHWPISNENYRGIDYSEGVDLTWWKNHPDPVSFFFWQGAEGFVGGYDYELNAGTIHVGDVIENRTSKLWQFGPGLQGQNARRKLTDDGKAYVELMTGTFSNNQPGYGWFSPHEVKHAKNFWYPIRDLEVVKNATVDASVTLQMRDPNTVFYGFNTTRTFENATAILKYGEKILESDVIDISPASPFTASFRSAEALDEYELYAELRDRKGETLVSYRPYKLQKPELPDPQERPRAPEALETVEDLYLTGRFVEQFSRPGVNPDDYYLKALELSPNDYRTNIAMGIRRLSQWKYEEAEMYLQRAADKLKVQYFQPKEGELFYYLGLARKALGKLDEAYRNLSQATWYYAWRSPAFYQLSLMESSRGNYNRAYELVGKAYESSTLDGRILWLYAALARKTGNDEKASEMAGRLIEFDPINFSAHYEKELMTGANILVGLHDNMQDVENNYLDIAINYMHAGLFEEGIQLLSSIDSPESPLIDYYLAWFYSKVQQSANAQQALSSADEKSIDYVFPYRWETEEVLQYAITNSKNSSKAHYLMGNLLYDRRPGDAIASWTNALKGSDQFAMVWRNLAFGAFYHENDIKKAIEFIEKAISMDPNQPLWYAEMAEYYDLSELDFEPCLEIMANNIEVVKRDVTAPKSLVKFYNLHGDYDRAIELLEDHHFRTWEGGRVIHSHYVDAHVLNALELMQSWNYDNAITHLLKALEYPENLEVGKPLNDERNAMIYFLLGKAHKSIGKKAKAETNFNKSVSAENTRAWPNLLYYQGCAYKELGNSESAIDLFNQLINMGQQQLEQRTAGVGIGVEEKIAKQDKSVSEAYYLMALGNLGLGEKDKAVDLLEKSLDAYHNNLWARYYMGRI
jgi:tetratricopeptide (TPR) repeat protein